MPFLSAYPQNSLTTVDTIFYWSFMFLPTFPLKLVLIFAYFCVPFLKRLFLLDFEMIKDF